MASKLASTGKRHTLPAQVPTEGFAPVEGEARDEAPLTLGVSCLMSYEHTGAVALACERGCTCRPRSAFLFSV